MVNAITPPCAHGLCETPTLIGSSVPHETMLIPGTITVQNQLSRDVAAVCIELCDIDEAVNGTSPRFASTDCILMKALGIAEQRWPKQMQGAKDA